MEWAGKLITLPANASDPVTELSQKPTSSQSAVGEQPFARRYFGIRLFNPWTHRNWIGAVCATASACGVPSSVLIPFVQPIYWNSTYILLILSKPISNYTFNTFRVRVQTQMYSYRQKRILNTLELIFQQWAQYDLWEQFFSGRALWGSAWGPIPTVVGSSVSFMYSCWSLQRDLCVWGDSEGVSEFSEQGPGSSTQTSNLGSSDLGIRSGMSYRTSGKKYAKRQERKPHENSSGLTRPCSMSCLHCCRC